MLIKSLFGTYMIGKLTREEVKYHGYIVRIRERINVNNKNRKILLQVPGPGQYDIVDYNGPLKQNDGSSMFRSSTGRWTSGGGKGGDSRPGPGTYDPREMLTTFHYNADDKWM